ncbi:MAG: hypothetical protein ACI8W3_001575 [Myxococcota bacterium]
MSTSCIRELPETALDIVGDIHGELTALTSLLKKLGYDDLGRHPEKRKLVFLGDLVDRGPDSPGVLRAVMRLVEAGNAQCIAGNHELNAVRNEPGKKRSGEGWWYGHDEDEYSYVQVDPYEKERSFLPFLRSLPGALEREDLRVVHACWSEPSIEKLRSADSVIDAFNKEAAALKPELEELGNVLKAIWNSKEWTPGAIRNKEQKLNLIPELARYDELNQIGNAIKVATSGIERAAQDSFYASGKWRMVERVPWWHDYSGPPVVVGHYWRRYSPGQARLEEKANADVFGDTPPESALGAERSVMCIDYSVGTRFAERKTAGPSASGVRFNGCLAALRVPEWELVFDDERPGLRVDRSQRD